MTHHQVNNSIHHEQHLSFSGSSLSDQDEGETTSYSDERPSTPLLQPSSDDDDSSVESVPTTSVNSAYNTNNPPTRRRKRDRVFLKVVQLNVTTLRIVLRALLTIMNAAVTIFGLGVGVGLILGDSLRGTAVASIGFVGETTQQRRDNTNTNNTRSTIVVRPATPNCRAMIRRTTTPRQRVQEAPAISLAAAHLPAQ